MTGDTFTKHSWMGDTGASCHMTNLAGVIFETTCINEQVKVGNSTNMTATKIGKWRGVIEQKNDNKKNILPDKVKLVPGLWNNLFSIGFSLKNNIIYQTKILLYHFQRIISSSHLIGYFLPIMVSSWV